MRIWAACSAARLRRPRWMWRWRCSGEVELCPHARRSSKPSLLHHRHCDLRTKKPFKSNSNNLFTDITPEGFLDLELPVHILSTLSMMAPLSSACLLNTPQKVQLFFSPTCFTIASIVQPYSSSYDTIFSGSSYCCSFLFTVSKESSL